MSVPPSPAFHAPDRRAVERWSTMVSALPARLRRTTAGGAYRPEIDGLRFVAIAIVVVGHLCERFSRFFPAARAALDGTIGQLAQRPGLGVYLFFTVSGFILASQAARVKAHPLSPKFLRPYFGRRILRIEPPYLLLLLATFLFITATGYAPEGAKQFDTQPHSLTLSLAGSVVYAHDLVWGTYPRLFPPGWSLEAEVQFYLLAPLFFAVWAAFKPTASRVALGAAGLLGGSLLSLLAPATLGPVHLEASIVRFAHFFWLGLVLAHAQPGIATRLSRLPRIVPDILGWGGLALFLVLPNAPDADTSAHLALALVLRAVALASVAAMFAAVFAERSVFRLFCAKPWVSLIGGACYSLYLTHLQLIQALTTLAAKLLPGATALQLAGLAIAEIVTVLLAGLAFYAVVERTFMRPDWPQALRPGLSRMRLTRA